MNQARDKSFGFTWRELTGDVCGFLVTTTTAIDQRVIAEVTNLTHAAVKNRELLHDELSTHIFVLLPGEYVTRVEVYYRDSLCITGLRFRTNKRVSSWLGSCDEFATRTVLSAPAQRRINAIYGTVSDSRCCREIGAVFAPLLMPTLPNSPSDPTAYTRSDVFRSDYRRAFVFETHCPVPRAVMIDLYSSMGAVGDLAVVSTAQYDTIVALTRVHIRPSEHWFVLAEDERIMAVGFVMEKHFVSKVCFRTTQRTSVWFGRHTQDPVQWIDCADRTGAFICGFQVEGFGETACTLVTGLGVIYNATEGPTAASKAA